MGRASMASGNREDLHTIALQHGIITSRHEGYIFSRLERNSICDAVNTRPMPRYTLLYGPTYRDILINDSTYPDSSLIITGQPRYDYLYEISQYPAEKTGFFDEMELKHPLIVWTSQPSNSEIEITRNINCLVNLLNVMPAVNLFIKPHPIETDLSIYSPLIRCKNVILSREVDIYKLLNACDLMITKNSTTAMEAAALNKPIVVLNLSGEPDLVDYVEEGIALGVYEEKDLPLAVKSLLEDDLLKGRRKDYVTRHLYRIDGRSSERVANFIKKLINNKTESH
jgi:CDP-glycerol glycerophosphotransferase (TagB/SpsB family)